MGAQNVVLVYMRWSHLPHRSFRALAYMALVSYDHPVGDRAARVYFAGPEPIARAIGRPGEGLSETDKKRVVEVISDLRERGAISDLVRAGNGRRAEYLIELDPPQAVPTPEATDELPPPKAVPQEPPYPAVATASGGPSATALGGPQGRTRGTRGEQEEQPSPEPPPHLPPGAKPEIPTQRIPAADEEDRRRAALAALEAKYPNVIPHPASRTEEAS